MPDRTQILVAVDAAGQPVPYESDRWVRAEAVVTYDDGEVERVYMMREQPEGEPSA